MLRLMALMSAMLMAATAQAGAPMSKPPGAVSCIDSQRIDSRQPDGKDTILFTVGNRTYRNHLKTTCPGLERLGTFAGLETEPWGSQLCEGDFVRVFDTTGVRSVGIQAYPRCVLGWFEPVPKPVKPAKKAKP